MRTHPDTITQAAQRLLAAQADGIPCAPIRDLVDPTDVAAAYAVQQQLTQSRLARGGVVVGRKIGLTSPAVQQQLGVDRPDFGVLFADMDRTGSTVEPGVLLQPKVEAELASVLGEDLDGHLDLDRVRAAVTSTRAALEIVDSRIADWDITYADTVADNASSGLYVLGDEVPEGVDPAAVTMAMSIDDVVVSTGAGRDCLGDPLNALLWLARTAAEFGEPLRAGQVVLSGALGPMSPVTAGQRVDAVIALDGSPLASVAVEFDRERA